MNSSFPRLDNFIYLARQNLDEVMANHYKSSRKHKSTTKRPKTTHKHTHKSTHNHHTHTHSTKKPKTTHKNTHTYTTKKPKSTRKSTYSKHTHTHKSTHTHTHKSTHTHAHKYSTHTTYSPSSNGQLNVFLDDLHVPIEAFWEYIISPVAKLTIGAFSTNK